MKKDNRYRLPLASIPQGKYEQDFECDTEFFRHMENEEITDADVKVHLVCEHKQESYDCTFTFKGSLNVPCDRCLDPVHHDVDTSYHLLIESGEDYDDSREDIIVVPYAERDIDVSGILYDTIVLTIPMRHVHPQGECNADMAERLSQHGASPEVYEEEEDE